MLRFKIGSVFQLIRCCWLSIENKKYVQDINSSVGFYAEYYRSQRPKNIAAQLLSVRHYVLYGEKQGLLPNPNFSPTAYLANNAHLADEIRQPLWHYLTVGKALNLIATPAPEDQSTLPANLESLPVIVSPAEMGAMARLAVVVHVFHYDLWSEIADALLAIAEPFDLYCTVTRRDGFDRLAADIQVCFPNARVLCYPNHGRDVFPFVHLVNSGILFQYNALCKIHTKKSLHLENGFQWRQKLIQGLLPDKESSKSLLKSFLADSSVGALVSDGELLKQPSYWGWNRDRVTKELKRIGIPAKKYKLRFPGGSMFWIKPQALELLKAMNFRAADFEREEGQLDGTLAHAIERIMGFLIQHSGQKLVEVSSILRAKRTVGFAQGER